MKKKSEQNKNFVQQEMIDKEMIYKAMEKFYEEIQKEKEREEKEILLRKLKELTKDKSIVLSNYMAM